MATWQLNCPCPPASPPPMTYGFSRPIREGLILVCVSGVLTSITLLEFMFVVIAALLPLLCFQLTQAWCCHQPSSMAARSAVYVWTSVETGKALWFVCHKVQCGTQQVNRCCWRAGSKNGSLPVVVHARANPAK